MWVFLLLLPLFEVFELINHGCLFYGEPLLVGFEQETNRKTTIFGLRPILRHTHGPFILGLGRYVLFSLDLEFHKRTRRGSSWKKIRQKSQIHTVLFHKTPGLPAKRPTDGRGRGAVFPFLGSQFEMRLEVQVYMDQHQTDQFWLEAKAVEWELRIYTLQKRKTTKSQSAWQFAAIPFEC